MDPTALETELRALGAHALASIGSAADGPALEAVEAEVLGRKAGALTVILRGMGALPADARPRIGALANEVRASLEAALAARRGALESGALEARLAAERLDPTLPGRPLARGSLHPVIETNREIARIFGQFGFVVFEGPEVESDELNFEALNIPPDHPARDLWDTLYIDAPATSDGGRLLLRTHTSPSQIRVMRSTPPPIRALMPGRCFRHEAVDASHGFEFFQMEGLMVDEGTTMAHLRGLLDAFAHAMFGPAKRTRFRPGYYPFTEPSVAFDVECLICGGSGCPACGRSGWMTILGAGMVHPVVLRNGGLDPERFQGFAFGMGTDRIALLRHGITDLRVFLEDDLRFLEQF
ncbi:MAG TPA: phenylalanine--tRNA ligase subunit alpha [Candidatus Limnocylindrales bacterium]|jgi:phenylalanyl-tRNA synthetase alpha chain